MRRLSAHSHTSHRLAPFAAVLALVPSPLGALLLCCCPAADLQRHLRDVHVETALRKRTCARCTSSDAHHNHNGLALQSAMSAPEDAFLCETPQSSRPSPGGAGPFQTPFGTASASTAAAAASTASPKGSRLSGGGGGGVGPYQGAAGGAASPRNGDDVRQVTNVSPVCFAFFLGGGYLKFVGGSGEVKVCGGEKGGWGLVFCLGCGALLNAAAGVLLQLVRGL